MTAASAVRVVDVVKSFRGERRCDGITTVLHGVGLDVAPGALLAVLGPSGCGKTTLLRVIAGFERADAGRVEVAGRVVADDATHVAPERRRVGVVPQEQALFPHLDVAGNVGYGLAPTERRSGERVQQMLELAGLTGFDRRMPHELSGGQQQRVALARALAPGPSVVLLDEPFGGLDAALRVTIRGQVRAMLRATGATAVLVTHDQEEALSVADRVAVMRDGRVVQDGTPAEVYADPVDVGVATFVGEANILPGTADSRGVATALGRLRLRRPVAAGPVTVVVRPEQVTLRPGVSGAAVVVDRLYFGHDAMLTLRFDDATTVQARVTRGGTLEPGQRADVSCREPVLAYADGSAGTRGA